MSRKIETQNNRVAGPKRINAELAGFNRPRRESFGPNMAQATPHEMKEGKCRSYKITTTKCSYHINNNTHTGCQTITVG